MEPRVKVNFEGQTRVKDKIIENILPSKEIERLFCETGLSQENN